MSDISLYDPRYTSLQEVKLELQDKVNFSNVNPEGVSDNEVLDNIEDAESTVELELSRQYLTPFQGIDTSGTLIPYDSIVPKSTIKYINKMCLLQTCILLMQTLFGKSEGVRGSTYLENYEAQLEKMLNKIIGVDEKSGQYLYPPFPGLALNSHASYFRRGIEMPGAAVIGSRSGSYTNQVVSRLPNGVSNWFVRGWPFGCFRRH